MPTKPPIYHLAIHYFLAVSLLLFLFFYPGQNFYQTFTPHSSPQIIPVPSLKPTANRPISHHLPRPRFTARAIVAQDLDSKTILFLKNPNTRLYPASTTKIMTALVSLTTYKNLDQVVTITDENLAIGHKMGLKAGEKISLRSLIKGLLIASGNDAALALAKHHPQGYAGFIKAMNLKAKSLGLTHTHYTNPSGVEERDHYTSARDLAVLTTVALKFPFLRQIVQTKTITLISADGKIKHHLHNTNLLLGKVAGVEGFKTGWTPQAGECLVTLIERHRHPIVIVLLGSQDRFGETTRLIDWLYRNYSWYNETHD